MIAKSGNAHRVAPMQWHSFGAVAAISLLRIPPIATVGVVGTGASGTRTSLDRFTPGCMQWQPVSLLRQRTGLPTLSAGCPPSPRPFGYVNEGWCRVVTPPAAGDGGPGEMQASCTWIGKWLSPPHGACIYGAGAGGATRSNNDRNWVSTK